jgi:hypothetical protein
MKYWRLITSAGIYKGLDSDGNIEKSNNILPESESDTKMTFIIEIVECLIISVKGLKKINPIK